MIRRRTKPRRGPARDAAYLARVRSLRCRACGGARNVQAHHSTVGRGLGQKASDYDAVPMCNCCHADFHNGEGAFAGWSKDRRRLWQLDMVSAVQALLRREQA